VLTERRCEGGAGDGRGGLGRQERGAHPADQRVRGAPLHQGLHGDEEADAGTPASPTRTRSGPRAGTSNSRTLLGRTIASVALEAGLSVPYVANLENGRGNPTLAALRRLAGALGVPLRDLLDPDGPATAAWPASLQRFSEQPRLRRDARWLARELGVDEHRLRAQLLQAMAAVPQPPHRPLEERDWNRVLDALVLILLPARP